MATLTGNDFADSSGHWYDRSGNPAYTVIGKNGKERNATLRDARELGLYPSVSAILKLEAAPALTNWMIQQACLSCVTLPRLPEEDEDSFIKRALDDSRAQAKKAAERGTYLHGLLELFMKQKPPYVLVGSEDDWQIIGPVVTWLNTNFNGYTWHSERSFACEAGYGGKIDLFGECATDSVTLDYKFKTDILPGKKLAYDNHATQLGAYANGLGQPKARCLNLFISSTVPGLIVPHEWTQPEIDTGYAVFQHLLAIWRLRRGL